jgi:hypothetical protein
MVMKPLSDMEYVIAVARKMLSLTNPWARDKMGYTMPDAWLFRDLLSREELTPENVEWMRRALLKYEKQIRRLGLDFDRLDKIRVARKAMFWRFEGLEGVKATSFLVWFKGDEGGIKVTLRDYSHRRRDVLMCAMTRAEVIDFVRRHFSVELPDTVEEFSATVDKPDEFFRMVFEEMMR